MHTGTRPFTLAGKKSIFLAGRGPLPKGTKVTVDNGKKATVVSYNLVDGLYILQIEGESSASLLGYKKTKSWVIH